jgi:hypothetical protein
VAQLAFFGLGEASRAAVRRSAAGSIECIIELGKTYIDYVTSRAAFYDLMWGDIGGVPWTRTTSIARHRVSSS